MKEVKYSVPSFLKSHFFQPASKVIDLFSFPYFIYVTDIWRSKSEFKEWLLRLSEDFVYGTSDSITDLELVQLVAESSQTEEQTCQCQSCKAVNMFLEDATQFVKIVSCSRIERRHIQSKISLKEVSVEHHQGGGLLLKFPNFH